MPSVNSVSVSLPTAVEEEEEVQSELVADNEQQNDVVDEVSAMDASVQFMDADQHDENLNNKSNASLSTWLTDRRFAKVFMLSILVAFGLGLVGSVIASHASSRRRSAAALALSPPPSTVPTSAPSVLLDHRGPAFEEYLRNMINLPQPQQQLDNNGNDIFDYDVFLQRQQQHEHQKAALQWLVWQDREFLGKKSTAPLLPTRDRVVQRYALVVFYMATGSWRSSQGGWANPDGAHLHECEWPGVYCHDGTTYSDDKSVNNHMVVRAIEIDSFLGTLKGTLPTEIGHFTQLGMNHARRRFMSICDACVGALLTLKSGYIFFGNDLLLFVFFRTLASFRKLVDGHNPVRTLHIVASLRAPPGQDQHCRIPVERRHWKFVATCLSGSIREPESPRIDSN
jgi:hypothetical protein